MAEKSSITDVLSGRQALQMEISMDTVSILYLGVAVLVAVAVGVFVGKKL